MSNNRSMFGINTDDLVKSSSAFIGTPTAQPQADAIALLLNDPAHSTLKELHLGIEKFNEKTIQQVSEALQKNKTLTNLELQGDKTSKPNNPVPFRSNFPGTRPAIKTKKKEAVILESIFRALRCNTTLKKLHVENADLNHENTITQLNMMLKENKTLNTLILKNCSLAGKVADLTWISVNKGLCVLELSDNNLSIQDLEHLAMRMETENNPNTPGNRHLIKINLTDSSNCNHPDEAKRKKLIGKITKAANRNRINYLKDIKDIPDYSKPAPIAESEPESGYAVARLLGGAVGSLASGAISAGTIALTIGFAGLVAAGPIGWAILGGIILAGAVCGTLMGDVIIEHRAAVREQAQQKNVTKSPDVSTQRKLHEHLDLATTLVKNQPDPGNSSNQNKESLTAQAPDKQTINSWKAEPTMKRKKDTGAGVFFSSDSDSEMSSEYRTGADILIDSDSEVSFEAGSKHVL